MNNEQRQVAVFHRACGVPVLLSPSLPDLSRAVLRCELLTEEVGEFREAVLEGVYRVDSRRLERIARELVDILYVTYGAALEFGIDLEPIFAAVHAANMTKVGPGGIVKRREDGKVLKPPGFVGPEIAISEEIARQVGPT